MTGWNCSLCGSQGTNKKTCPLNLDCKNPDPFKHQLAETTHTTILSSEDTSHDDYFNQASKILSAGISDQSELQEYIDANTINNLQPKYLYHASRFPVINTAPLPNAFFSNRANKAFAIRASGASRNAPGVPGIYRFKVIHPISRLLLLDSEVHECINAICQSGKRKGQECSESLECSALPSFKKFNVIKGKLNLELSVGRTPQDEILIELCKRNLIDGWIWTGLEEQITICLPREYLQFDAVKFQLKDGEWTDWISDRRTATQIYKDNITDENTLDYVLKFYPSFDEASQIHI